MASQVEPNYWAAILGLAVVGLIARRLEGGRTRDVVLASIVLAAMALVRPTEATVLAGAIGVYILLRKRMSSRDLIPLGIGLVLGWLPWIVEMSDTVWWSQRRLSAGGPALRARPGRGERAPKSCVHGRERRGDGDPRRDVVGRARRDGRRRPQPRGRIDRSSPALLASLAALAVASEYLFLVPALAPRFLLPAYMIASVPFAIGMTSLLRGRSVARALECSSSSS